MKKLGITGIIILLLVILVAASVKVTALDRSPVCDQYRVSFDTPLHISDVCIKGGK